MPELNMRTWFVSILMTYPCVATGAGFDCSRAVSEVRRPCPDAACLEKAYQRRIGELAAVPKKATERCAVTANRVIGKWRQLDEGDFEEFVIEVHEGKPHFISWRHHRPELIATWRLEGCNLSITDGLRPELDFAYEVFRSSEHVLRLKDRRDGTLSSYRRVSR